MIYWNTIQGRITICLIVMIAVIFEKLTWCVPHGSQILFLEEAINSTFDSFENQYSEESFTINTVGCVIPSIDDNKSSMYYSKSVSPQCPNYKHRLLKNNQTHIWIVKENLSYFNIIDASTLECCYRSFYRPYSSEGIPSHMLDDRIQYLHCFVFRNIIEVNNEFVKVNCSYNGKEIYNQYFVFTPKKPFTFNREKPFELTNRSAYNVIIVGLGSMSKQHFYKTMPKTVKWLKKNKAIELKGFNALADDTFDNIIPLLVGMNTSELYQTCWPYGQTTLDECPFIWNRFKDMGYYTALVEDTAKFGMFNRGKFGFRGSPTDYYIHPFMHESEKMKVYVDEKIDITHVTKIKNIIKFMMIRKKPRHLYVCMGDKYYFEVLLKYIESLTKTLRKSKLFGLFWETSMSHDYFNYPAKMDNAYYKLFHKLELNGYLNETVLIFLSDHGRNTEHQMEERLPFVFILMPPSFRNEYKLAYYNLKTNRGRLTTPFDIHQTLIDLIDLRNLTEEEMLRRSREFYTRNRGISLFLQIPRNRTCEIADINTNWCTCYSDVKLEPNSPILIKAIVHFTNVINAMLEPYPECLKLVVESVIVAKKMLPVYKQNSEWRDLNLIVRMAPGGGIFETMMRLSNNNEWTIVDHIRRLNLPSFNTFCIEDTRLKLFCYCKSVLVQ